MKVALNTPRGGDFRGFEADLVHDSLLGSRSTSLIRTWLLRLLLARVGRRVLFYTREVTWPSERKKRERGGMVHKFSFTVSPGHPYLHLPKRVRRKVGSGVVRRWPLELD